MQWLQQVLDILFPPSGRRRHMRALTLADIPVHVCTVHTRANIQVHTCMSYTAEIPRALIQALKFDAHATATVLCTRILTDALVETIAEHNTFGETVVITSVPPSFTRKKVRGHDHVRTIAASTAHTLGVPYVPALVRARETKRQMTLTAKERLQNMKNAFTVHKTPETPFLGAHVIVVDDVVTTGATLVEARRACGAAGAAAVSCIALAAA